MGRELLGPEARKTNLASLEPRGASRELCQPARAAAPAARVPGSADTPAGSHLARCCLVSPKNGRRGCLAPSSTRLSSTGFQDQHCHRAGGRGHGSYTDPVLPQKEPLSDE